MKEAKQSEFSTIIGIDPGITTGVAIMTAKSLTEAGKVISTNTKLELRDYNCSETCTELLKALQEFDPETTLIVLENPALLKFTYTRHKTGNSANVSLKIAQDVGHNKALGKMILAHLKILGYMVRPVPPRKASKINAESFNKICGYTKRSNQHQRDAAMLILGITPKAK